MKRGAGLVPKSLHRDGRYMRIRRLLTVRSLIAMIKSTLNVTKPPA